MKMRVTVCELPDWNFLEKRNDPLNDLTQHVRDERSDLVVLPEMPAYPWFASIPRFSENVWREAVKAHDEFVSTLSSFPAAVISTGPVQMGNQRLNQAFFWDRSAYHPVRCKYYLPEEEGFYELTWFHRGDKSFRAFRIYSAVAGILICSELMFNEWARMGDLSRGGGDSRNVKR